MADVLLVDGHNVAFRSFFGIGELSREDGFPTGAIYGYAKAIWRIQDSVRPGRTAVFFDMGRSAKRTAILREYKANRPPMAEELRVQLPHIRQLARLMDCAVIEKEGVEADDLIAAHALAASNSGERVAIASSDKDFAQIVCDRITLWNPPSHGSSDFNWVPLDSEGVKRKFSVTPEQIVDYLCLVGDAVDNVSGVPRVGAKTAAKLLGDYGSIDGIMGHLDELPKIIAGNMMEFSKEIERNRSLIAFDLEAGAAQLQWSYFDIDALVEFFEEFELHSLIPSARRRYGQKNKSTAAKVSNVVAQDCFPF